MPRILPPEIRDRIIDEFSIRGYDGDWPHKDQDNCRVLRTLLFVSRDVAIRARHHLFERVDLSLITVSSCPEATAKHEKRISLLADIVASSATSRNLGILPHIRRVFIFCHCRHPDLNYGSGESSEEGPEGSDDNGNQRSEQEIGPVSYAETQHHPQFCDILAVISQKTRRIDEFHLTTNDTIWDSNPRTFDALAYEDWSVHVPDRVQRAIFDFIRSPRYRIKTLSLIQFFDVPRDFLMGTHVERAFLHAIPSESTDLLDLGVNPETKDVVPCLAPPPILQLQTLDYILGDVTKFICSRSQTSVTSVRELSLDVPLSWIYFDVDENRFVRLGQVISEFYKSIYHLNLIFQGSMSCPLFVLVHLSNNI